MMKLIILDHIHNHHLHHHHYRYYLVRSVIHAKSWGKTEMVQHWNESKKCVENLWWGCNPMFWSIKCFMGKCRFPMVLQTADKYPTINKKLYPRFLMGCYTMINFGEHFLGAAGSNLLVQNEKGIMPAIHNNQAAGICANNFSKLIEPISRGLVCNGFEHHPPSLQISLFVRAGPNFLWCNLNFAAQHLAFSMILSKNV